MKSKIKVNSEEITISEKIPQTSSNNCSDYKKYNISKIKNKIEISASKISENKKNQIHKQNFFKKITFQKQ